MIVRKGLLLPVIALAFGMLWEASRGVPGIVGHCYEPGCAEQLRLVDASVAAILGASWFVAGAIVIRARKIG